MTNKHIETAQESNNIMSVTPTDTFITNYYRHCGQEWELDYCDSFHNDECPVCGAEIEPYQSDFAGIAVCDFVFYPEHSSIGSIANGVDGLFYAFTLCGEHVRSFTHAQDCKDFLEQYSANGGLS